MKIFKIIIVVVIVAALGFGVYKIVKNQITPTETEEITVPDGCEGVVASAQQLIESRFNAVNDGEFEKLKAVPDDLREFFVGQNVKPDCMVSVNTIIRNRYLTRFIDMTKKYFAGNTWKWNDVNIIETLTKEFLTEEKNNADLLSFKKTCSEFSSVSNYYSKVYGGSKTVGQCNQRPKSINDQWNYDNTESLLDYQPAANKPVDHTTQYENTRKAKVRENLYNGHVAFVDALVELAKANITTTPTETNYGIVVNTVWNEITAYQNQANALYGVKSNVVKANAERWNDLLVSFHEIVEADILNINFENN